MVGQGGDAAGAAADAVTLVARCAGRCGSQPSGHRRTEERADAAGARGGVGRRAGRGHRAGKPGAAVCQSRRRRFVQQSAAEIAGGDCAGAGAADQPRPKPRRRRHQDGVPEIRNFPRGVAGVGFGARQRRSRSQGRADRAAPDAAIGARRQCNGRDARRRTASRNATGRRREPCAVARPISTSRKSCCRRRGCRSPKTSRCRAMPAAARLRRRSNAGPSAGATLNLLQEALQELGNPVRAAAATERRPWRRT